MILKRPSSKNVTLVTATLLSLLGLCAAAPAAETVIPASSLIPSTSLYTNDLGNVVVTTGGGNAPGIGDPTGRNDDGFTGPINLGFTLTYFSTNYSTFYINNNGNVSFGGGISAYIPSGLTGASQPVISPYFGDADSRGTASGVVHLNQSANQDVITWDHIGYFDEHDDKLNTFQLILRGPGYSVPNGEGQIGFYYTTMGWESTDTSTTAAIGFGDGSGNGQALQGSNQPGTADLVQNSHIWFNLNGGVPVTAPPVTNPPVVTPPVVTPPVDPSAVPEPGSVLLTGAGVLSLIFFGLKRRSATQA